jgi:hypothetical protein
LRDWAIIRFARAFAPLWLVTGVRFQTAVNYVVKVFHCITSTVGEAEINANQTLYKDRGHKENIGGILCKHSRFMSDRKKYIQVVAPACSVMC